MKTMLTIDGHSDTMLRVVNDKGFDFFAHNAEGHMDWPRLKKGGINLQVMALFVESHFKPYQALWRTMHLLGAFHEMLAAAPSDLVFVKSKQDLDLIKEDQNKSGLLLGLEGGEALTDTKILQSFYALGLRLVGLTWNQRNLLADGVGERQTGGGLTNLGREMVQEMNGLGIIVDVSHLSEKSFWDVVEVSNKPFVASHSNVFSLVPTPRNLKDEQIEEIARSKGLLGMNFCPAFLTEHKEATITDILRHIDYIIERWGPDCLGLGSDFDGIDATPQGLESVASMGNLIEALHKQYASSVVEKIAGGNWMRILLENLPPE